MRFVTSDRVPPQLGRSQRVIFLSLDPLRWPSLARCAKVAIKPRDGAAIPPGAGRPTRPPDLAGPLAAGEALDPGRHLAGSDVGVDLSGGQALMAQRGLNHRQRRAGGQARSKRMSESVRRTADVKVRPLPVALDEVTQRASGQPAMATSDQERGLARHRKAPGAVEVHQVDNGLASRGVERDLALVAALADHLDPLAGEAVPGVTSRNGKNRTLRIMERPQWPEFARLKLARLPDVISRQVDVLPTER